MTCGKNAGTGGDRFSVQLRDEFVYVFATDPEGGEISNSCDGHGTPPVYLRHANLPD